MTNPFFSIIIPTLNEAKYLPHLLADLTNQTFPDFEVIIVDGNSTDKTVALAQAFRTKLKLKIIASPTRHVCVQRNLGAQHASADVLIFCDADNSLPSYFLQGIKYRLESEACDLATTYISPEKNTGQYTIITSSINLYYDTKEIIPNFHGLLEGLIIVRNKMFINIGGFDTTINLGEGHQLAKAVIKVGGKYSIFKDPQYVYSLRRLKKYGTLRTISVVAQSEIFNLLGITPPQKGFVQKLYPMLGGGVYSSSYQLNKKKIPRFLKNIQKLLQEL